MTATERFIKDAIEGGWKAKEHHEVVYYYPLRRPGASPARNNTKAYHAEEILLDPAAWKSVGKVRGWDNKTPRLGDRLAIAPSLEEGRLVSRELQNAKVRMDTGELRVVNVGQIRQVKKTWRNEMHRMIDALADGKTIEQYLETL